VYDDPRRVYSPRNISLYKKLLADRNISDVQRDVIGKMLAEEEAKLLDLPWACPNRMMSAKAAGGGLDRLHAKPKLQCCTCVNNFRSRHRYRARRIPVTMDR
jgi:hypothetical protein